MITSILFDLDGVLVDACDWHYHSLNMSLSKNCNFMIERNDHLDNFNGLPTRQKLKILLDRGLIEDKNFEQIWRDKQNFTISAINRYASIDSQKIEMHNTLKNKYNICCVTNSIRETAELMLGKTGQLVHMQFVVTNEDVKKPKPNPECYFKAIEKLSVESRNCLIIEDSEKGLMAAKLSNCHVLKVTDPSEVNIKNILNKIKLIERGN